MNLQLPTPIESYFGAGNGLDADAVAACFTPDAKVRDEGREHVGREAIRSWAEDARRRYSFHAEPRSLEGAGASRTVTAHLTGDFPGAPADLSYRFELEGDRIARLEIGAA